VLKPIDEKTAKFKKESLKRFKNQNALPGISPISGEIGEENVDGRESA